jgi:hypothetical protein
MAELIANYSALVERVSDISIVLNLPVTTSVSGSSVLLLPIDRLLWTERSARLAQGLIELKPGLGVWITGDSSPRAEAGLKGLAIKLEQRCGSQLPLLD